MKKLLYYTGRLPLVGQGKSICVQQHRGGALVSLMHYLQDINHCLFGGSALFLLRLTESPQQGY